MTIAEVVKRAGELMVSAEVAEFLGIYGIQLNPWRPVEMVKALKAIDSRKVVRFERESDKDELTDQETQVIMSAAARMGMLAEMTAPTGRWYLGVVYAGARRACHDRLNDLAKAIASGQVFVDNIVMGCGDRELNEAELAFTQKFAPVATSEYELGEAAIREIGAAYPDLNLNEDNCIFTRRKGTVGVTIEAIERTRFEEDSVRAILGETHQIYREFTLYDLARAASWTGMTEVEVAGCPSDPAVIAARKITTYRYEVARTTVAAIMLLADLDESQL